MYLPYVSPLLIICVGFLLYIYIFIHLCSSYVWFMFRLYGYIIYFTQRSTLLPPPIFTSQLTWVHIWLSLFSACCVSFILSYRHSKTIGIVNSVMLPVWHYQAASEGRFLGDIYFRLYSRVCFRPTPLYAILIYIGDITLIYVFYMTEFPFHNLYRVVLTLPDTPVFFTIYDPSLMVPGYFKELVSMNPIYVSTIIYVYIYYNYSYQSHICVGLVFNPSTISSFYIRQPYYHFRPQMRNGIYYIYISLIIILAYRYYRYRIISSFHTYMYSLPPPSQRVIVNTPYWDPCMDYYYGFGNDYFRFITVSKVTLVILTYANPHYVLRFDQSNKEFPIHEQGIDQGHVLIVKFLLKYYFESNRLIYYDMFMIVSGSVSNMCIASHVSVTLLQYTLHVLLS